jgi:serine O-acetyltransferase
MPDVFFLDHPVGSVLGRATYGLNFSFSQNCTVGNNKGIFPTIGKNVQMLSGSKILGRCKIGDNVIVSANTYIKDTDIPANSLVFGSSPNLVIKIVNP